MPHPALKVISYSSLSDWQYCPHYFKLTAIDKLKPFEKTVYSHWGTLIHKYMQNVLLEKLTAEEACNKLRRTWSKFCKLYGEEGSIGWSESGSKAILSIKEKLIEEFGSYEVLQVEERLAVPVPDDRFPQKFKGFIDIVLEVADGRIVVIDFKSCANSYLFNKFRDKFKDYQLSLYKFFY